MTWPTLIQIAAACVGVVGSLFFAIGIMRQSVETMANLSGSYWDWNPHTVPSLAAQKADYLFGGGIIVLSFALQWLSFICPANPVAVSGSATGWVPWIAIAIAAVGFVVLRHLSKSVAEKYRAAIWARLQAKSDAAVHFANAASQEGTTPTAT